MIDQILQNSTDNIEVEIREDGVLADADGDVTVVISNPNGIIIYNGNSATKISTGKYQFSIDSSFTDILGTFSVVWSFTISSTTMQHTSQFEVVSAISTGYLLSTEYRQMTSLDVSEKTDAQLAQYIKRATHLIESYLGGSIRLASYEEVQKCVIDYPNSGIHIQLDHTPVNSLTSVSLEWTPNYSTDLLVSNIRINKKSGFLEYFGLNIHNSMIATSRDLTISNIPPVATIVYEAGFCEIPEKIELATSRLTDQLLNLEIKAFKDIKSISIKDYSETYSDDSKGKLGLGVIGNDEVVELLKEYKHPIMRNRFIV